MNRGVCGCTGTAVALLLSACTGRNEGRPEFGVVDGPPRIVFTASGEGGTDLYVMEVATSRLTRVAQTPEKETDPDWLPGGQRIVFGRGPSLWICGPDGSDPRRLTADSDVLDRSPNASPDGRQVLFDRATSRRSPEGVPQWFGWDAYMVDTAGGPVRRITERGQFSGLGPRFLPSGTEFLFFDAGIWRGDLTGRAERLRSGVYPVPSPTDDLMAYVEHDVWLARLDGTQARRLTPNMTYCMNPRFSPDGQWVYFRAGDSSLTGSIYRIRLDGSGLQMVVPQRVLRHPTKYLAR